MTNYDVIKKLLGPIDPVGESHTDEKRFSNLTETIEVMDKLLFDLHQVAQNETRHEHSMSKAGKEAADFIKDVKDSQRYG